MLPVLVSLTLVFIGQIISFKESTRLLLLRMKLLPFLKLSSGFMISRACLSSGSHRKWSVLKLHHVAIATPGVDTAANFYRDVLGTNVSVWKVSKNPLLIFLLLGNIERNTSRSWSQCSCSRR